MENKCKQCGYEWEGKEDAKACPRCKRYDWKDEKLKIKSKEDNFE